MKCLLISIPNDKKNRLSKSRFFYHYRECVCDFFYASRFSEIKRVFCASGFYVMNFWFLRIYRPLPREEPHPELSGAVRETGPVGRTQKRASHPFRLHPARKRPCCLYARHRSVLMPHSSHGYTLSCIQRTDFNILRPDLLPPKSAGHFGNRRFKSAGNGTGFRHTERCRSYCGRSASNEQPAICPRNGARPAP